MSICEAIKEKEDIFRRSSIYLLNDDIDRDFEFFVFVDAGNEQNRPLFLRALRIALGFDSDSREQVENQCRQDWDKRFSDRPDPKPEFNILNWLKIAIEDYPFRLFVVINPKKWQKNGDNPLQESFWFTGGKPSVGINTWSNNETRYFVCKPDSRKWKYSKFLYKRICWISQDESTLDYENNKSFNEIFPAFPDLIDIFRGADRQALANVKAEYFKLWLFLKWIQHVYLRIRGLDKKYLNLYFYELGLVSSKERKSKPYFPSTVPLQFRIRKPQTSSSVVSISFQTGLVQTPEIRLLQDLREDKNQLTLSFIRHTNVYRLSDKGEWYDWLKTESGKEHYSIYGEFLSGNLTYLSQIFESVDSSKEVKSFLFFMRLIEAGLFRIGLIDERIQQNYKKMNAESAGFILQQRVYVTFFKDIELYEQGKKPEHQIYTILPINENNINKTDTTKNIHKVLLHLPKDTNIETIFNYDRIGIEFLIIHQGILDKWSGNKKSLHNLILTLKDEFPFIIVTSGRGTPSNLPNGVKFLPFTGVETCIVGQLFEKLTLLRQIFSLKD